jgi:two-component system, NarL family, nitrate/nitrite response regulator NarL
VEFETAPATILVADDAVIFRSGVSTVLEQEGSYEVVEASDTPGMLAVARERRPDIALVDAGIGEPSGQTFPSLRDAGTRVVVWDFQPRPDAVVAAVVAGAQGYLSKDISRSGLLRAIDAALHGEPAISRDLVGPVMEGLRRLNECHRACELLLGALSPREREVLALIASGARNRTIAVTLEISEFTVKRHVQNILRKLDLPSRQVAGGLHRAAFSYQPDHSLGASAGDLLPA